MPMNYIAVANLYMLPDGNPRTQEGSWLCDWAQSMQTLNRHVRAWNIYIFESLYTIIFTNTPVPPVAEGPVCFRLAVSEKKLL